MMKSCIMALLIMISLLLISGCSCGRLLAKNSRFIAPDSPSAFDPENTKLSFRLSPIVQKTKKIELPASNKADGVFNLLPKGAETPTGPRPNVNSMVTERRLSTSSNSPGVVHMQMIRPKSQEIIESHHSHGDDHVQQKKSNKRKLGSVSSPGPGDGH
jgi:hypothetical protein